MLAWAGATWAEGTLARDRARSRWEERLARSARVEATQAALGAQPIGRNAPGMPVARIVIPRIGLDEVGVEGTGTDELNAGPGHLPQSAVPGEPGNAVISAHRDRHFNRLGAVAVGDTITTETLAGVMQWVVVSRQIVERDRRVLRDHGRSELTLTTCWPIRFLGPAPERLVLAAEPVAARPVASGASRARTTRRS